MTGPNKRLMMRSQALKLPVGDVPDWEFDDSDSEPSDLKSPAERQAVIRHASYAVSPDLSQLRDSTVTETMLDHPAART